MGGGQNKKIKSKVFKDILLNNNMLSLPEQKRALLEFLENWRGFENQTDDITVLGLRI